MKKKFKLLNNPFRAYYVAFTDILIPAKIKMNQKNETIARLLEKKKNLILQGAPGTGKTYTTASIALKVLGIQNVDWEKHEAVMKDTTSSLMPAESHSRPSISPWITRISSRGTNLSMEAPT